MGMTIEKAHEILSNGLVNAPSEHEWCIAFKMAIDTLRKYQRIEHIFDACLLEPWEMLEEIKRVVEDENVN